MPKMTRCYKIYSKHFLFRLTNQIIHMLSEPQIIRYASLSLHDFFMELRLTSKDYPEPRTLTRLLTSVYVLHADDGAADDLQLKKQILTLWLPLVSLFYQPIIGR